MRIPSLSAGRRRALGCAIAALTLALVASTFSLAEAQKPAQATSKEAVKPKAELTWADKLLQQEGYATPPEEIASAVLAPRHLNVSLTNPSPDKKWFLDEIGDGAVPMSTFSKPFHELGGVFVDFKANRARALTIRGNVGIQIISATDGTTRTIDVPKGARVSNATWSPDGTTIAFYVHVEDATHIWAADITTGRSRQVTPRPVLATLVSSFDFTKDGKKVVTVLVPEGRPPMPTPATSPAGPEIKIGDPGDRNRLRTFASLMGTPQELALLEWHATGQVALLDIPDPAAKPARTRPARGAPVPGLTLVGRPDMIRSLDVSPDGLFVRVNRLVKPFSYIVPVSNFGYVDEIWDLKGQALAKVSDRELNLGVADDTTPPPDPTAGRGGGAQTQAGKREVAWRSDGQGLTFLEQEPAPPGEEGAAAGGRGAGGRGAGRGAAQAPAGDEQERPQAARRKDRVFQWLPPFDEKSLKVVYESNTRISNHRFSPDMQTLFLTERSGQNTVEFAVELKDPTKRYTLARYRADDIYANPGSIAMVRDAGGGGRGGGRGGGGAGGGGTVMLSADGSSVFYQGMAYDKAPEANGPKTFIDRVAIKTGEKTRIYESDNNGVFERVATILDADAGRYIVSRETPSEINQAYLIGGGTRTQLTKNEDFTPDLTRARRERFIVERPDGFKLRVMVTLPPDYKDGTRLPAMFWFYPREYPTQEDYDRGLRTFNKNAFQTFSARSMQFLVRLGYAIVEPDSPIVGPQGQMNNNYVHDLRNNLWAVIEELDRRQLVDRNRIGIGGHSYGAFSTVNAMVHTPFFKAGIAGDGAYNRTLTPIGFQSERRDLWEARDVYLGMSPFLYANNLTGALLMYHGLHDQNVGTDPTNSTRMFHALNGLGKTVAMYLYPLEDHGPAAKETLLDLWARWSAWLDKYVKNPVKPEEESEKKR
ncbi:MAG: prolyl oligopeptidase family serine peptidase [Acidobacteriota bacterium]